MLGRRPVVVLLLVAALSALALSVSLGAGSADPSVPGPRGAIAIGREGGPGLDAAVVPVLDEARKLGSGQRHPKPGPVLLAVLAGLVALRAPVSGRPVSGASTSAAPVTWWSPISGRAPPRRRLAV